MNIENKVMLVTGGMRFIGKTFFVFAFVENSALRVGSRYHRFLLFGQLFVAVIRKGLFAMFFAVFVHFIKQFFCISLRLFRNCLFSLLFEIRTCFYVGSVHKNCFCIQISFLCRCFQHPAEYILYCRVVKPVLKVITHCGKMWH